LCGPSPPDPSCFDRAHGPDVLRKDARYPILHRLGILREKGASGFHTFRHSAASIVNDRTGNLKLAQRLRGNVHADRYVFPVFLTISDVGGRVNLEFALYGRVLIDVEDH
jgi:hypothetical protein